MSINDETCKAEIEARMTELIDILAAFPAADIDPRAWDQLLVYHKPSNIGENDG